ncbi:FAD/NAD(P)-binding protein [Catenuloplanes japonicus]|uniref:FAD/NAD(P)-binding protein n=1 Tax=Catenuloplanes japonicus TaxID=33876 RepID=UPI00068E1884|nr:FAD/NAD(P)-binding protein [Catenuloplanes japonicus]
MTVAIIGAGASGILTARALRRRCPGLELTLIDDRPAGGIAYRAPEPWHLLNSRAAVMGADEPGDFAGRTGLDGDGYAPRRLFGDYLRAVLADTPVARRAGRAVRVTRGPGGLVVHLADGLPVRATDVVLALGPPRTAVPAFVAGHPELVPDPWAPGALDVIDPRRPVIIAGTGLTAVDTALTLRRRGQAAPITMVSRHGLLPRSHAGASGAPADGPSPIRAPAGGSPAGGRAPTGDAPGATGAAGGPAATAVDELAARARTLRSLVRGIREIADHHPGGWRPVVEAVRPHTNRLWTAASDADRDRFLRHCARHWDVHRHRMAAPIAAEVAALRAERALLIRTPADVDLTDAQVVNAAGPGRLPHAADPLVAALIADGLARVGPFGLGLDVGPDGRAAGGPLWVVGPLRRGRIWETTAIPEIREQARTLAETLGRAYRADAAA